MALDIMSAAIGYDFNGTKAVIDEIQTNLIGEAERTIQTNIPLLEEHIGDFWIGASADMFKYKLEIDSEKLINSLELIRNAMQEEIKQMMLNVNNSDAVIAQDIMPGFEIGTYNASIWEPPKEKPKKKKKKKKNIFEKAADGVKSVAKKTAATVANVVTSTVEGAFNVAENISDAALTVATVVATPATALVDKIAGTDITSDMWDATSEYVAVNHTKETFDYIYNNTGYGDWIKENNFGDWEKTRKVGNIIGETTTEILVGGGLSSATSMSLKTTIALTAAANSSGSSYQAGFAKISGKDKTWKDYAKVVGKGTLDGTIDGLKTYGLAKLACGESKIVNKLSQKFGIPTKYASKVNITKSLGFAPQNGQKMVDKALSKTFSQSIPKYVSTLIGGSATSSAGNYAKANVDKMFDDGITSIFDKDFQEQTVKTSVKEGVRDGVITTFAGMTKDAVFRKAGTSTEQLSQSSGQESIAMQNANEIITNKVTTKGIRGVYKNSNVTAGLTYAATKNVTNPLTEFLFGL